MKKWAIAVVVVLLGVMLTLQRSIKQGAPKQAQQDSATSGTAPTAPTGVDLPPEASGSSGYVVPVEGQPSPSVQAQFPSQAASREGYEEPQTFCEGSSVKNIMAAHGKTWGNGVRSSMNPPDVDALYVALSKYYACEAVVKNDMSPCGQLPAGAGDEGGRSPRTLCVEAADLVLFSSYMAGRSEDFSICKRSLGRSKTPQLRSDPERFCPDFAKGLERVCDKATPDRRRECLAAYPAKRSDCTEKQKNPDEHGGCTDRFDVYTGIKTNSPMMCPDYYKASCQALFSQSRNSCGSAAAELSMLYCAATDTGRMKPIRPKGKQAEGE